MKKRIGLLGLSGLLGLTALLTASLLALTACSHTPAKPADLNSFLLAEGVALTCDMQELAASKEYVALMGASQTLGQVIAEMASQDYSLPQNIYLIKLPDDTLLQSMRSLGGEVTVPANIREKLPYKINGALFANLINAGYGSETIAAASVASWGKSYIEPEGWSDNTLLLLEYPGEFSSMVSFVRSGDEVISASAVFVQNGDKEIMSKLQEYLGGTELKYDHYTGSELEEMRAG